MAVLRRTESLWRFGSPLAVKPDANHGMEKAFQELAQDVPGPGLLQQLREDYEAHYGGWHLPGFHAVALVRFGKWSRQVRPPLRSLLRIYYKIGYLFVRDVYGIEMADTVELGRRVTIGHQHGIVIHPFAKIGDDCTIRQGCTIGAGSGEGFSYQVPRLGNRVELGAGAVIVGAVVIGDDVKVGPNAVVLTSIPAGSVVLVDAPRIIKPRATAAP